MSRYDDWQSRNQSSAFLAGLVGAIIGAAGVAAAIFLSDKETRRDVSRKITDLKQRGSRSLEGLRMQLKESAEEEVPQEVKSVRRQRPKR